MQRYQVKVGSILLNVKKLSKFGGQMWVCLDVGECKGCCTGLLALLGCVVSASSSSNGVIICDLHECCR